MAIPTKEKLIIRSSFSLPYRGGEIFGVELHSLYVYRDIVQEKFPKDMETVRRPSTSSKIGINLLQTEVDEALAQCIASQLSSVKKAGMRVAFVIDHHGERLLRSALNDSQALF